MMRPRFFRVGLGASWVACLLSAMVMGAVDEPTTAAKLIERLHMAKIPGEGAWFAVTSKSDIMLPASALPPRYVSSRPAGTAIYALVTRADFSAMHRLKTDEIWHFYAGDPIKLLLLYPDGKDAVVILGADVLGGQQPQFTVPAGVWMGAIPKGDEAGAYSLFGTTMAPGFDYADYEPGYRETLQAVYPARAGLIAELTRAEFVKPPVDTAVPEAPVVSRVFASEEIDKIAVAPGVELRELVGRVAKAKSGAGSIAWFSLKPGKSSGMSYNKVGEEVFLIIKGKGTVVLDGKSTRVAAGSVVAIKPHARHALWADAGEALEFYAITWPAFSPEDYVRVE